MMTVAELISQLMKYPDDYRVIVSGYEGGYDDISAPKQIEINLNVNDNYWYFGRHSKAKGGSPAILITKAGM